jgi:hypothetical protein
MTHVIPRLGRVRPVPLREVWTSEPYSFDPWLMQPENLQFLAESLGLPGLEVITAQQQIGPFFADIVCKIVDTDHVVLIENQLDQADHRHLGQVLTYAPHVDAKICVWVAERIRDEHRAAVDWLNRITGEGYGFFGVEVQAVRIADSMPAPLFNVVARPNDFSKIVPLTQDTMVGNDKSDNARYWARLHEKLIERAGPIRRVASELKNDTYWAPIAESGRAYIWAFRSRSKNPYVSVGLSLYNEGAVSIGERLAERQARFETELGELLEWYANKPGTAYHAVFPLRYGSLKSEEWPAQHEWLVERMLRLQKVVVPAAIDEIVRHDSAQAIDR